MFFSSPPSGCGGGSPGHNPPWWDAMIDFCGGEEGFYRVYIALLALGMVVWFWFLAGR